MAFGHHFYPKAEKNSPYSHFFTSFPLLIRIKQLSLSPQNISYAHIE